MNIEASYHKILMELLFRNFSADINMEESQPHTSFLFVEKAHSSLLFIHIVLCSSSSNHVHPGSQAPFLGCLLHSNSYDTSKHSSSTKIHSFHRPLPPFRKHYVSDKVQCYGIWTFPIGKFVRVGCYQKGRKVF